MQVTFKNVDRVTRELSDGLRAMARLTGLSERRIVRGEAAAILKSVIAKTPQATATETDRTSRRNLLRVLGLTRVESGAGVTINSRKEEGIVWWRTRNGQFQPAGRIIGNQFHPVLAAFKTGKVGLVHFTDADWSKINLKIAEYRAALPAAIAAGRKSAGLARGSWTQIADSTNIPIDYAGGGASSAAIAKARSAVASDGKRYINGYSSESGTEGGGRFSLLMTNRLPYWPKIHLDSILLGVMAGRASYFKRNLQYAVFESMQATQRAYPWMKAA